MQQEDHSWLITGQLTIFLIGCIGLYVLMYWKSGGREAFYESRDAKEERWQSVFGADSVAYGTGRPKAARTPAPK